MLKILRTPEMYLDIAWRKWSFELLTEQRRPPRPLLLHPPLMLENVWEVEKE